MIKMHRMELFASILVGIGVIVLMAMAFGIWPGNWSLFIAISLFIVAGMLRGCSRNTHDNGAVEKQQ